MDDIYHRRTFKNTDFKQKLNITTIKKQQQNKRKGKIKTNLDTVQ
jgi:hypothetical protein